MTFQLFEGGDGSDADLFEELPPDPVSASQSRASRAGKEFDEEAFEFVESLGAQVVERYLHVHGYPMDARVVGTNGRSFYLDAHGTPDRTVRPQAGMRRTDTMLKFGFKALRLLQRGCDLPILLITSHLPAHGSQSEYYLTELSDVLFDAIAATGDLAGRRRLHSYFNDDAASTEQLPAPWREVQLPFNFAELLEDEDDDDA